ncbi:hypothetical protein AVEN_76413-1 [Araneus ventricosus]|uniref:Uncharacterized protein n=1 Tax=Araneus ventricosus TaxID=182803 RepID=A0A4Y2TSC9_ARAVE|nr:hypothetical protein AVEN_76413-1 [Araneus ventricosus]
MHQMLAALLEKNWIGLEILAYHLKVRQVRSLLGNLAVLSLYHLDHIPIVQKMVEDKMETVASDDTSRSFYQVGSRNSMLCFYPPIGSLAINPNNLSRFKFFSVFNSMIPDSKESLSKRFWKPCCQQGCHKG